MFGDARISIPANVLALPIFTLPGVEESDLTPTLEGLWMTEAECRLKEVEYIDVVDQNSPSLASFRVESLSATSSTAADKTQ